MMRSFLHRRPLTFQKDYANTLPDMSVQGGVRAPEYRRVSLQLRVPSFPCVLMISCGHIAEQHASAISSSSDGAGNRPRWE